MEQTAPRPEGLLTATNFELTGTDARALRRGVASGRYTRIKKGAYDAAELWAEMTPLERHIMLIHAVAESNPGVVFSHWSAAALRGLPVFGAWPSETHVLEQRTAGGRSEPFVRKHCLGYHDDDVVDGAGGVRLTSILRTAIDLGAGASFETAVMVMDAALHRGSMTAAELADRIASARPHRGGRTLSRAARFADAASESPGESLSGIRIHQLGFPAPQLQLARHRPDGSTERPDFDWPDHRVVGEFDGKQKYLKPEYLGRMTPGEAVYAEKRREDRLRRDGEEVARWGWDELMRPELLGGILLDAGLPRSRRS